MIYTHTLERALRYYPQRTALASGDKRSTFRELHERVAGVAAMLARRGCRRGDRLAILLPNEPEYIELIYACSRLGVIAVPLNTRLSPTEIDHVLMDAGPCGLVRHSSMPVPTVRLPWELVLDQEPLDLANESVPDAIYDPEATLALVYTSGTTGHPKGVAVSHANVLANIHFLNYWTPYEEGGVYLHAAPMFHIIDLPLMFAAPAFGTCQVTIPQFNPQHFCETVQRERVPHTALVPTMINLLSQLPDLKKYDLSSLKHLAYGGSPMAPDLIRRMRAGFPNLKLLQGYGLTETGFLTGLEDREHTEDKLLSCGRPCPGIDVRIVDEFGSEVEVGQPGELVARGANVMRGYWNNPQETNAAFRNGMFRTGDVGYQSTDGYFYLLDRIKDMIVTGGENVYCGEVEAVIDEHPAVREAAVFGIPDPQWGELVAACVVLKPGKALSADELIAHCRRSLANYKIPRRIEFSESELPKSGSGKIVKRILRDAIGLIRSVQSVDKYHLTWRKTMATVQTQNRPRASGRKATDGRLFVLDAAAGRIFTANTDGSDPKTLVTRCRVPDGIVVDVEAGYIYWTNMGNPKRNDGSIERIDLDGRNRKTIVPEGSTFTPKQMHLEKTSGKLYWCDREGMRVMRCNLDGSKVETLVDSSGGDPRPGADDTKVCVGITVDPQRGKFYWTQKGPDNAGLGRIFRANINLPEGQTPANRSDIELLFDHLPEPIDLELDLQNRVLYWTDRGDPPRGNSVNRARFDPATGKFSQPELLVMHLEEGIGIVLDVENDRMFMTDLAGSVYTARLDGSDKRTLLAACGNLTGIILVKTPSKEN